jgi:hypothetical protein
MSALFANQTIASRNALLFSTFLIRPSSLTASQKPESTTKEFILSDNPLERMYYTDYLLKNFAY